MNRYSFRVVPSLARVSFIIALLLLVHAGRTASAGEPSSSEAQDGLLYAVDRIELQYERIHPENLPLADLEQVTIVFGVTDRGLVRPTGGLEQEAVTIGQLSDRTLHGSAIQHLSTSLVAYMNQRGVVGVWAGPHPADIDPQNAADLRPGKKGALRILLQTAVAGAVRTVARGDRIPDGERINNPAHDWIRENSPLQAAEEWEDADLLDRRRLDRYAHFLSRYPNRYVDLVVAPLPDSPGRVGLDLQIYETKPWTAWARIARTGTKQTSSWRESFGFEHTQLTGHDDQLSLMYSTTGFDDSHSLAGSYELPVSPDRRTRLRISAGWSKYQASDVGFDGFDFSGEGYSAGAQVIHNFFQSGPLFLDLTLGLRVEDTEVENPLVGRTGEATFVFPEAGLRLERRTRFSNTLASIAVCYNVWDTDRDELDALGRTAVKDDFGLLSWQLSHSFYLERLFQGDKNEPSTLAHELVLKGGGQTSFDERVPPDYQQTVGGFHTVRGYRESALAGDSVAYGTLEYRLHVPQAFGATRDPGDNLLFGKPFRWLPQHVYGIADWDLALKAFVDVGWAEVADRFSFEHNETLVGTGVGVDLRLKRNLFLTVDWGFAATDMKDNSTTSGSSQVEISVTILY